MPMRKKWKPTPCDKIYGKVLFEMQFKSDVVKVASNINTGNRSIVEYAE